MNYAKAFREIREETQMTRPALAKSIGITNTALWKIERGLTAPKEKTIIALCRLVRVPLAYFYQHAMTVEDYIVP